MKERWREPHILFIYALKVATHYHYAEMARSVSAVDPVTGAMSDAGTPFSRSRKADVGTDDKAESQRSDRRLGHAGTQQIVNMDKANRPSLFHDEEGCDRRALMISSAALAMMIARHGFRTRAS